MATSRICANTNQYRLLRSSVIGFSSRHNYIYNLNLRKYSDQNYNKSGNNGSKFNKKILVNLAAVGVITVAIGNWQKYIFVSVNLFCFFCSFAWLFNNIYLLSLLISFRCRRLHEFIFPPIGADANANVDDSTVNSDDEESSLGDQQIKKKPKKEKVGFRDRKVSEFAIKEISSFVI